MIVSLLLAAAAAAAPVGSTPTVVAITPARTDAQLDPAAVAAARELLSTGGTEKQFVETAKKASYAMIDTIVEREGARSGTPLPDDFKQALKTVVDRHLVKYGAQLTAVIENGARIYARYFTVDEIREIQRLQNEPVMVKFKALAPEVMGAFMQVGMAAAASHQDELEAALKAAGERWIAEHEKQTQPRRS